jgi:serine phosphatase RsbU (regulator of sigma subunit)
MQGRHFYVEDLNSSNGTVVNNEIIQGRVRLTEGDKIRLCRVEFLFHERLTPLDEAAQTFHLPDQQGLIDEDEGTGVHETNTYVKLDGTGSNDTGRFSTELAARWGAMLEITQALGQFLTLDKLLPKVLDSLFKMLVQAERGCIILKDESGQLRPGWVKLRSGELRISRTVINDVMESQHAIVSRNAVADPRFEASQSVTDLQLRSVMCAPLIDKDGETIGVVQVDTSDPARPFEEDDLEVLVAVAAQTAIAITVSRLHETEIRSRTLERDMALAAEVQRNCLPEGRPDIPGYKFFDYYAPAEQIGGDYFDYIPLSDGRLGIVIGDVVGHGVPAALTMSKVSAETRFLCASIQEPSAVLESLNGLTCRSNRFGRFITLLMMVLDPAEHTVTLAAAGHLPPLLRRQNDTIELLGGDTFGPPLGTDEDTKYRQCSLGLAVGETMVLYTDGVTEARNEEDEYGGERLAEVVAEETTPGGIGTRLVHEVESFLGKVPRQDDLCVVCVGRK